MAPSPKAAAIVAVMTAIAGMSREEAIGCEICPVCRQALTLFRDALSAREHAISGLCQACQDRVFD